MLQLDRRQLAHYWRSPLWLSFLRWLRLLSSGSISSHWLALSSYFWMCSIRTCCDWSTPLRWCGLSPCMYCSWNQWCYVYLSIAKPEMALPELCIFYPKAPKVQIIAFQQNLCRKGYLWQFESCFSDLDVDSSVEGVDGRPRPSAFAAVRVILVYGWREVVAVCPCSPGEICGQCWEHYCGHH